jgi:tetratricopeptide (TPR) repeat protein
MFGSFRRLKDYADSKALNYVFIGVLLLLSFIIAFFKITDYDIWWHLKTGEYILAHGIPSTDPFSFMAAGHPWVTHEWLAEILFYLLYRLGGLTLLIAFKACISAVIAFLIFKFGRQRNISAAIVSAVAIFAVSGMSYMMYPRPHVITFLFLAILSYFLFSQDKSEKSIRQQRWILLPVLFLFWANIHAGFILGLGIYWIVVLKELFLPGQSSEPIKIRVQQSLYPAILASLICLVNPNGYQIYTYTIAIAGNPVFKSTISEWVSPIYLGRNEWLALGILGLASVGSLIAAIFHFKRRPDISLIIVGVAISAWMAMRNIQNLVIVLAFAILSIPLSPKTGLREKSTWIKPLLALLSLAWIITLFILIFNYQLRENRRDYRFFDTGIQPGLVPIDAAAFLNKVNYSGNILNILSDGGYLIWSGFPRWKVFVDGRLDVYGEQQIENYRNVVGGAPGALNYLNEQNINAAVLPMPPGMGDIRAQLAKDSLWSLVYFDDYYLIYMCKVESCRDIINKWGYQVINPLANGYGLDSPAKLDLYIAETKRALYANPKSSLANAAYGFGLQQKGEYVPAANAFKTAITLRPGLLDFYRYVARLYVSANIPDSAKIWYAKALVARPADPWNYYDLGMLYARQGDYDRAETYFNEAARLDPKGPAVQALQRLRSMKSDALPAKPQ